MNVKDRYPLNRRMRATSQPCQFFYSHVSGDAFTGNDMWESRMGVREDGELVVDCNKMVQWYVKLRQRNNTSLQYSKEALKTLFAVCDEHATELVDSGDWIFPQPDQRANYTFYTLE